MTTPAAAEPDPTKLDDDQLISQRATLRTRLGLLSWHDEQRPALENQYEALTEEFDRRAGVAWRQAAAALRERGVGPAGRQP